MLHFLMNIMSSLIFLRQNIRRKPFCAFFFYYLFFVNPAPGPKHHQEQKTKRCFNRLHYERSISNENDNKVFVLSIIFYSMFVIIFDVFTTFILGGAYPGVTPAVLQATKAAAGFKFIWQVLEVY